MGIVVRQRTRVVAPDSQAGSFLNGVSSGFNINDVRAGVLELASFLEGDVEPGRTQGPPNAGLFLISFFVDVEATLTKLHELGLGGPPRRITQSTPNGLAQIATVRDPDGVVVLLTRGSTTQRN